MTRIKWTDITFTGKDIVKLAGFLFTMFAMYSSLVDEIRQGRFEFEKHKEKSELRFAQLERCCGLSAVIPKAITIEGDE